MIKLKKNKKDLNKLDINNNKKEVKKRVKFEDIIVLIACLFGGTYIGNTFFNIPNGGVIGLIFGGGAFYFYYKTRE